jgi:hypothetical protein
VSCKPALSAETQSRRSKRGAKHRRSGQALTEFAVLYSAVILPLTFMVIFVAEMLWIWHAVSEFTRDGARFAATHCYQADGTNVTGYMQSHVPPMIDQAQFQNGQVAIQVQYLSAAADGSLTPFAQPADCGDCVPDSVSVSVSNYQFARLAGFLRLPPVTMPSFTTNLPMESAGFQDASGVCAAQ